MTTLDFIKAENIRYLVVHCSNTPDDEIWTAPDIHQMHLGFGWDGVGYHRIITKDGKIERGRPDYWLGAHVYEHNHESLGVCLIGRDEFTSAQMESLKAVLQEWKKIYPQAEIRGHCDFDNTEKTCPNFDAKAWAETEGLT